MGSPWRRPILLALIATGVGSACGDAENGAVLSDAAPVSEDRVAGSWALGSSLLVIPWDGGIAQLRAVDDPWKVVWEGSRALPPAEDAWVLGGHTVALRTPENSVYLYRPEDERLEEVGTVEAGAARNRLDDQAVLWNGASVLRVSEDGAWTYESDEPIHWASPAAGGSVLMVLQRPNGSTLRLVDEADSVLSRESSLGGAAPGLVVAWGRRALFRATDGGEVLSVDLPGLEVGRRFDLGRRRARILAASPSSHEVYVGADGGRVLALSRVGDSKRQLARLPEDAVALRPGLFGQQLLAFDGGRVYVVSLWGEDPVGLDTEWRPDLPLGLPAGRVIGVRGDSVVLFAPENGDGAPRIVTPAVAEAAAWWLPLRWNPRATDRLAGAVEDEVETADDAESAVVEDDQDAEATADAGDPEEGRPFAEIGADAPAAGYYAVAGSLQSAEGARDLLRTLTQSGYPTAIHRLKDEGGQLWYRAIVGPYATRSAAEAAARQLRRERGMDAWVTEITAGTLEEF